MASSGGTYTTECSLCPKRARAVDIAQCQRWGSWHVYYEHPEVWYAMFGDREPHDPRPDETVLVVSDARW